MVAVFAFTVHLALNVYGIDSVAVDDVSHCVALYLGRSNAIAVRKQVVTDAYEEEALFNTSTVELNDNCIKAGLENITGEQSQVKQLSTRRLGSIECLWINITHSSFGALLKRIKR